MNKTKHTLLLLALLAAVLTIPTACEEDESDLGLNLEDPATIYNGIRDTAYDITAYTIYDDSLLTSGYSAAMIGNYTSATYGPTEAIYYTQIGLPSDDGIAFTSDFHIDSIVLNYRIESFYPASGDSSNSYNLHFEIRQLSEQLMSDSAYYGFDELAANGPILYNATQRYSERDTALRFVLNDNAKQLFTTAANEEEFEAQVKGLRIRMLSDSDPSAVTINLAAVSTQLTVHYHYGTDTSTYYNFVTGYSIGHFNQFKHNYASTPLNRFASNTHDTLKNSQSLYLTPTGGTNIYLRMDDFLKRFQQSHPYAVIHYAELILPCSGSAENSHPDMIYAYRTAASGYRAPIADLLDDELSGGYDGKYDAQKNQYRLRISRHVQQLLRNQTDYGTILVLNQRRTSALSTVVNGTRSTGVAQPMRIEFVYTEINQ